MFILTFRLVCVPDAKKKYTLTLRKHIFSLISCAFNAFSTHYYIIIFQLRKKPEVYLSLLNASSKEWERVCEWEYVMTPPFLKKKKFVELTRLLLAVN